MRAWRNAKDTKKAFNMIIDIILDRRAGFNYRADDLLEYAKATDFNLLVEAFAEGDEERKEDKTKRALVTYACANDYNLNIISFILSCDWTKKH